MNAERVEELIAALDRGEVRVAEQVDGDWRVNAEAQEAILEYFRLRQMEPKEVGPFEYHDKIPLKRDYAEARRPRRAAGGRALRLVPLAGRRDDAELREHRRVGRAADDGRHVGDRRLGRADRRGRAPRRRRRHRRRARAAGRAAGDRRGRRVHRLALRSSPRACASERGGARRRTSSLTRRSRSSTSPAPSPSSTAARCRRARSWSRARGRRSFPPGRTSSRAR